MPLFAQTLVPTTKLRDGFVLPKSIDMLPNDSGFVLPKRTDNQIPKRPGRCSLWCAESTRSTAPTARQRRDTSVIRLTQCLFALRQTTWFDCGHRQRQSASSNPPANSQRNHTIDGVFT